MTISKKKINLIGAILFGLTFLISLISSLRSIFEQIAHPRGLLGIIGLLLMIIGIFKAAGLAASVLFEKRSWNIPALLLIAPTLTTITYFDYARSLYGYEIGFGKILLHIIFPLLFCAYSYFLIAKPTKLLKKIWILPAVFQLLFTLSFYTFFGFLSSVCYMVATALLFYWLAYPKGKRKNLRFKKAPGGASAEGELYVSMVSHLLLLLFTFGVYLYIWIYKTTERLNSVCKSAQRNATAELLLCLFIPFYSIFWYYKTAQLLSEAGEGKIYLDEFPTLCLLLSIFIGVAAPILVQDKLNALSKIESKSSSPAADPSLFANTTPAILVERAKGLLDNGDWQNAMNLTRVCLSVESQNGDAHFYNFLARYHAHSLEEIAAQLYQIDKDPALQHVIAYADENRKAEIAEILGNMNQNLIYFNAMEDLRVATTPTELDAAAEKFGSIIDFRDSREQIENCEKEKQALLSAGLNTKKITRNLIITAAFCIIMVTALQVTHAINTAIQNKRNYNEAIAMMEAGEYEEAKSKFNYLNDYKNSEELYNECTALSDLYDQLLSTARSNLLELNLDDYTKLNQDLPHIAEIKDLYEKYSKFAKLTYDISGSAEFEVCFYEDSKEVLFKLDHGYSYYSNTTRLVGTVFTSMKDFTGKRLSAEDALKALPVSVEPAYYSTYSSSSSGPITIYEDRIQYTYTYNRINYTVDFFPAN